MAIPAGGLSCNTMRIHYLPAFAVKRKIAREGEILHEGRNQHRPGAHKIHCVCRKNSLGGRLALASRAQRYFRDLSALAHAPFNLPISLQRAPYAPWGAAGLALAPAGCAAGFGACGITSQAIT